MVRKEIRLAYDLYTGDRPREYEELCRKALDAMTRAYAKYSGFSVGAGVLLDNGEIICGNNQENIAYPSGLCAERVALFYAHATYPDIPVRAMAVTAALKGDVAGDFISPCGACRQVMLETAKRFRKDFDLVLMGKNETLVIKASALIPFAFDSFGF